MDFLLDTEPGPSSRVRRSQQHDEQDGTTSNNKGDGTVGGFSTFSTFASFAKILKDARFADVTQRLDTTTATNFQGASSTAVDAPSAGVAVTATQGQGTAFHFARACLLKADLVRDQLVRSSQPSHQALRRQAASAETGGSGMMATNEWDEWEGEEDAQAWEMEAKTWILIALLHAERHQQKQHERERDQRAAVDTAEEEGERTDQNPYEPPLSRAQVFLATSNQTSKSNARRGSNLSELNVVREWLQATVLPVEHGIEARKGYWTFTKNKVKNAKRVGGAQQATSLDPDVVHRGDTRLEMEDASYEKASWRFLFECARNGRLDLCFEMCKEMNQGWKAASLRGGILYGDPALSLDSDPDMDGTAAIGNRNRALWKAVCRKISQEAATDPYERALYGSLGGELRSVLAVSHTWEEHLWAYVNSTFEARLDTLLTRPSEQQQEIDGKTTTQNWWMTQQETTTSSGGDAQPLELKNIFDRLEQTQADGVHLQANDPFRTFQRYLILDEMDSLLLQVEERLQVLRGTLSLGQYARFVRFFAHYILFARLVQEQEAKEMRSASDLAANSILRLYVELLEEAGQEDDLVALYASSLDAQNAIDSYAQYLKSLDADVAADVAIRRSALLRAKDHDLDLPAVARRTVALIFDDPLSSATDERLIKALDWLSFDPATAPEYVTESNALMRSFLADEKLASARRLLVSLSADLAALSAASNSEDESVEHLHYQHLFDALHAHERFVDVWSERTNERLTTARTEKARWLKALQHACHAADIALRHVLEHDWLKLDVGRDGSEMDAEDHQMQQQRLQDFAKIRKIFIPDLIFRLHNMLVDTAEAIPENLHLALQLPTLVADERHKLYLEFIWSDQNKLQDYLASVRQASLLVLDTSRDVFAAAAGA